MMKTKKQAIIAIVYLLLHTSMNANAQYFNTHFNSIRGEVWFADNDNSHDTEDFVWVLDKNSWSNGSNTESMRLSRGGLLVNGTWSWHTSLEIGNTGGGSFQFNVAGPNNSVLPTKGMGIYDVQANQYRFIIDNNGGTTFLNGNTAWNYSKEQVGFGYNGTRTYLHVIKSRHNNGGKRGNAIDFFLWNQGEDGVDAAPSKHAMTLSADGTVGFGTEDPSSAVHIVKRASRSSPGSAISFKDNGHPTPFLRSSLYVENGASNTTSSYEGRFGINTWGSKYPFLNIETVQDNIPIIMEVGDKATVQIFQNQVLIGSNLPFPSSDAVIPYSGMNYTLGVRGRIVSSAITCKDLSQWADYVFDEHFELKSLQEVETFINENKHLPDVPSESELMSTGIDVVNMLKVQMQKIEELTLYTIQQQKQIDELKSQLKDNQLEDK